MLTRCFLAMFTSPKREKEKIKDGITSLQNQTYSLPVHYYDIKGAGPISGLEFQTDSSRGEFPSSRFSVEGPSFSKFFQQLHIQGCPSLPLVFFQEKVPFLPLFVFLFLLFHLSLQSCRMGHGGKGSFSVEAPAG